MGLSRQKGFEIVVDTRHHVLRCRLWGLWDLELAQNYRYALMEKIAELRQEGASWRVLADFKAFSPLSVDVQGVILDYLLAAKTQGMQQLVYVGGTPGLLRRLDRVSEEFGDECFVSVESEEQAMQWLLK